MGHLAYGQHPGRIEIRVDGSPRHGLQHCLTVPCSWIAALPGQVVARQSPEVDYVSGATQSTNAFYYAVVEALARAK
jgi:major membrane immunogen (membrane-anchored lipoprotein)